MRVLIADERPSIRAALMAVLDHDPACEGVDEAVEAGGRCRPWISALTS